ncbi:2Fe-2S iron-sulfur cluster binding domain-containing protein [Nocardia sp. ET3-3]|uniref:2Fe-2S iron-sulfur cluster binding domain-containing protein n=1 Tax=Nocardia terrae TaxID=2675851 RepID=A0A7K1V1C9_9NOCA|nr:PDR/VanB family oxidoreductase [Nocardia terrae]MVU80450.1 2Fe-2S iron-sulfur cluster binding domain-containing protein [Nocardia terrae]
MSELTVRVSDRRDVAEGVFALELAATGGTLPRWTPGAHIDVHAGAVGVRQYSLCGDPADENRWRIAILRETAGRGGSEHLYRTAEVGTSLRVSVPRNNFELEPSGEYLFLAGGIGITPILPMVTAAVRAGARWSLHYGARTRAHLAFTDELSRYEHVNLVPQNESGLLPLADLLADTTAAVYCCGPAPLLDAVETEGARRGLAVHTERFTPRRVDNVVDRAFSVRLAHSGQVLAVAADRSIVDVLEGAGVAIVTSCREGTCGSCETTFLEGEVQHRDSVLTADERAHGRTLMPCVSRALSDVLVLDL